MENPLHPRISPHNYPEDYERHGIYEHKCGQCAAIYYGAKTRMSCSVCWQGETIALMFRVKPWMDHTFGPVISNDKVERNHRFFEEATELVQSLGMTRSECHQLVDYVFDRPVGEPFQEVGGTMITLAALCLANAMDMHNAGEVELMRIWGKAKEIRAKQAAKPKHSPLPQAVDNSYFGDLLKVATSNREKWLYGEWDVEDVEVIEPNIHVIPPMDDPLGKHWDQPDRNEIQITPIMAIMTHTTFDKLKEYSTSIPSGVYPGKMWKCKADLGWELRWFGHVPNNPKMCSNHSRRIWIEHDLYTDKDKDRPDQICDSNGQVVLAQCKLCRKAECEIIPEEQCQGRKK